ncbi:MAG: ABC transporter permease [Dehalococcoidia bacterium]
MSWVDALRVAFRAIAANGLRSLLTTLGMVIGVGSVIVLIAVGQGAQKGVQDQIRGLGKDLIFIQPAATGGAGNGGARGAAGAGQTLTTADSDALANSGIVGLQGVAPQISAVAQVITVDGNQQVTVIGTTPSYSEVRGVAVAEGAFITDADVSGKATTVVLGSEIASTLFPDGGAVGQQIRLSVGPANINFTVAGVMERKGGSGGGEADNYVYIPVTTIQSRIGFNRSASGSVVVNQINVQAAPNANQDRLIADITALLSQQHGTTTADFTVKSQEDLLGASTQVSRTLSILLGSIAGISLVVGGIGVMNIMLVSVTERTREIGIRRAVGARAKDIVTQFVTEALALCVGGGLLGIAIGVGIALGIDGRTIADQDMTTVVQPWSIAVAFGVAAGIGALSGSYPAFRASRLDPIQALRTE